jgi:hypothetical protein
MKNAIIILSAMAAILFTACNREVVSLPPTPGVKIELEANPSDYIIGNWKQNTLKVTPALKVNDLNTHDLFALKEECELDNRYLFRENNQLIVDYGMDVCSNDQSENELSAWEIQDEGNYLIFDGRKHRLESFDPYNLLLSYELLIDSVKYKFLTTYVRE